MAHDTPPRSIADIGISAALNALLPFVRAAGKLAAVLQPLIGSVPAPKQKEHGNPGQDALTHADLLIEDRLGSDILQLFTDASFRGEERAIDSISRFIPDGRPFIITLDPINGTLFYRDGLPQYETIVTICDREWNILGAIVYRPAFDDAYIACITNRHGGSLIHRRLGDPQCLAPWIRTPDLKAPKILHLDETWNARLPKLRDAGYEVRDIWTGYVGQPDWPYAQTDLLLGKCCAMSWRGEWAQFIDAGVFGFMMECAGGAWRKGELDREKLIYSYTIAATDAETADLLVSLL